VSGPVVDYMLRKSHHIVTVASADLSQAETLVKEFSNAEAVYFDVSNDAALENLIKKSNIVISLLPAIFHVKVAKYCIQYKINMVTASYISPEMKQLHASAAEAGIIILNEIGLDPGIDHISTLHHVREIKANGGKIISYKSMCGGLPAPEAATNPLGYKFSWNPRGVLTAGLNAAKYKEGNKIIDVKGENLFNTAFAVEIEPCFSLECLPNRDSIKYGVAYELEDVETMFRGTLRYKGFSLLMSAMNKLGLFNTQAQDFLTQNSPPMSWPVLLATLLPSDTTISNLEEAILKKLKIEDIRSTGVKIIEAFKWLGFFDEENIAQLAGTYLDTLCNLLQERLTFQKKERDMILLHHEFIIQYPKKRELFTTTLIEYGEEGYTAMAKTVGVPVAVAAQLILDGRIKSRGVYAPLIPEIYEPLYELLKDEDIKFLQSTKTIPTTEPEQKK